MSGSLRFRGDIGKWTGTTGNSSLGVSQSALTVAGFYLVTSDTAVNSSLYGMVQGPQSNGFGGSIGGGTVSHYVKGVTSFANYGAPIQLNKWTFFCSRLIAAGTSTIFIDGQQKASTNNVGNTISGTNQVFIGINAAGSANVVLGWLAIWNGVAITDAQQLRLRDGLDTPSTLSTPATSYWNFGLGTPGNNPVAADTAMHDQIGTSHFITIPGAGGSTTNAVYDSSVPVFVAPITITAQIPRSGNVVHILTGTNPALGTVTPAYITGITADPTFNLNSSNVSARLLAWSDVSHIWPFVAYQLYTPGTPPTAIAIAPTDHLVITSSSNWVQTQAGFAAAETVTVGNYVGGYEPGLFGYGSFDSSTWTRTYKPGWGGVDMYTACAALNVLGRCTIPWSGALTSTSDGYPLTVASGSTASTLAFTVANTLTNAIDHNSFPMPWGSWVLTADENNPGNPMTAALTVNTGQSGLVTGPVITPGTLSGGVELHRRFTWTMAQGNSSSGFVNAVTLAVKAPTGQTAVTLKNMVLTMPGDTPVDSLTSANNISQVAKNTLTNGTIAPPYTRFLGDYVTGSSVNPGDLLPNNTFTQRGAGTQTITISAVQFYDITAHPNVYSQTKWSTTNGVTHFVTSDNGIANWMIVLANWGLDNSWVYGSNGRGLTNTTVCEFVTPTPHGLYSGQFVTVSTFTAPCHNDKGSGTCHIGGTIPIWVTSPTSFVGTFGSTLINSLIIGQITGNNPVTQNCTITINSTNAATTIEQQGLLTSATGNPAIWFSAGHAWSDATATSYATRLFSSTARGTLILIQMSNEIFIPSPNAGFWQIQATLLGYNVNTTEASAMQRLYEIVQIFKGVWGSDSGSIKLVWQPWTVQPLNTYNGLVYAQNNAIPVDKVAIAPYIDTDLKSITLAMAAAQMAADSAISVAHTGGAGGTQLPVLPIPGYLDIQRYDVKYNQTWNGPNSLVQQHRAAINSSGYGTGIGPHSFVYLVPPMIMYEGGISDRVPPKVSTSTRLLRTTLSHDLMYYGAAGTTSYYDLIQTTCQHFQQPGPAGTVGFESGCNTGNIGPRSFDNTQFICPDGGDGSSVELWVINGTYQGQPRGLGLSNKMATLSTAIGGDNRSHDIENQIIEGKSFFDWLAGTVPTTPSFFVSPLSVTTGQGSTLTLTGSHTAWTSGSTIVVTNSIIGVTAVSAGTWTAITNTSATLTVTVGTGVGTWKLTIDGTDSPLLTTVSASVATTKRKWLAAIGKQRRR